MGAKYLRDVYPGEIVEITKEGFRTVSIMGRPHNRSQAFCIFEYVYFARPDSIYEGKNDNSKTSIIQISVIQNPLLYELN